MSWNMQGSYVESCNCDAVCPCTASGLTAPADNERCQVTLAFHVDSGTVDGVDVGDRSVVVFADAPQVMASGDWRLAIYVDSRADDAQMQALLGVFSGSAGGPMAALSPLFGEVLGADRAPISFIDDGRLHSVTVGDLIDIQVQDGIAPQLGDDGPVMKLTNVFHPANTTVTVARSTRATGRDVHGYSWDFSGRNAHSAPFAWSVSP